MGKEIYRRIIQGNPELTRGSVKPKLESGDIFMAKVDGGSGDIQGPVPEQNISREPKKVGRLTSARRSLSSRIMPTTVAHAHLDNPGQPQDNPFSGDVNIEVVRAWSDYLAEDNPEKAAREAQIASLGYEDDIRTVYGFENRELTQEAKDALRRFGAGEMTVDALPEDFSRILEENGISKELIEKYQDQPAILKFSLLFGRHMSNINHEIDARRVHADTDIENQPQIAPLKKDDEPEEEDDRADASRRRESDDDGEDVLSGLSDKEREMFGDELRGLAAQRQDNQQLRGLIQEMRSALGEALQDPDVRSAMEDRMSAKLGRPYAITDVDSFMESIFPIKAMEERARAHQLERMRMAREREEPIYVPKSLEELAILVMDRATPEYKRGGDRQLLRYKKERVERPDGTFEERETDEIDSVNTINFMHWARDNYMLVHLNNPTTDVNFFSDIATNVRGQGFAGPISFYEITATESYFLKETKAPDGTITRVEDDEYKALRTQMLLEVYTMQIIRNPAISYVLRDRAEREKMLGAIANANILNPVTKFFSTIFGQPSMQAQSIVDLLGHDAEKGSIHGRELQARKESNFAMGTSTREILAAFMTITDYKSLRKIFDDPDCPLFTYEYDKWDVDSGKKDSHGAKDHTAPETKTKTDRQRAWYYTAEEVAYLASHGITAKEGHVKLIKTKKGKPDVVSKPIVIKGKDIANGAHIPSQDELRAQYPGEYFFTTTSDPDPETGDITITFGPKLDPVNGEPPAEFMKWLNIFLTPTPDQRQQEEVRQRFRLAVIQKNGISYRESQSAELMGYSIAQITGVAAAADIDAVGFDWWTRMIRFRDKRKREKSSSRNASYGSEFNMEGVKRIALTFMEGARDIRGRSLQKLILGGEGRDIHTSDKESPLKKKVDYQRDPDGRIKFVDPTGNNAPVALDVWDYKLVNRTEYVVVTHPNTKTEVVEPRNVAEVVFLDRNGNVVDIGNNKPQDIDVKDLDVPIDFESDLQKQFHPNHLLPGSKIYQWVFSQKGMDFAHMVDGEDSRANPIFKWGDINEIKHGLIHDIRYMVKTWGKVNFAETHVYTEKIEQRNERGRLVGKDSDGHEVELDEDWYVLHNGKRGHERLDPSTYMVNREMTVLESMFDYDALYYINQELLHAGLKKGVAGAPQTFTVKDPLGKRPDITIDYSQAAADPLGKGSSEFPAAVWKGMFDYMVAAEIQSHRSPGSGYDFQNYVDIRKIKEVLELSGMLDSYQVNMIWDRLGMKDSTLFSQYLATEFTSGGITGLINALLAMAKGAIS